MLSDSFISEVKSFDEFGKNTLLEPYNWSTNNRKGTINKATNEYWTSSQRQAHSLHEISYRACYKPQLPAFFIERLTSLGDGVYDPFMGRGTTQLEAWLQGRKPLGNDVNPLSKVLLSPRFNPPTLESIKKRLDSIDLSNAKEKNEELLVFYHPDTLLQIISLKEYLIKKEAENKLDDIDQWIRMVAVNRLTGHSGGFFSVYTLPPNQAVSVKSQTRINKKRNQIPEKKDIIPRIIRKSKSLLKEWRGKPLTHRDLDLSPILSTADARHANEIVSNSAKLVVTSPPFLDVVDYQADNWLRCWFIGIDSSKIGISQLKSIDDWQETMTSVFQDLHRIVKLNGYVAFEVGEVRNGTIQLEDLVVPAGVTAGFDPLIIMINSQNFTKTANAWGVDNQKKGTNTNRIVVFQKKP